jgi:hypothetical protein
MKLGGHLLHIGALQVQFLGNLPVGQVQSHKIEAQYPYFEWLMMSGKNGVRQIIEAFATIFTFIALFGRFFFIESSFDYSFEITKRTLASFRPVQFPNSFITLSIINQRLSGASWKLLTRSWIEKRTKVMKKAKKFGTWSVS